MVPAKAALHVELHIVPHGTIQTKHGTREPHRPSVISGKTTNQLLSLVTQGVSQGLRYKLTHYYNDVTIDYNTLV